MLTVWLKYDVFGDLKPPMMKAHGKLVSLYAAKGLDFYVTSRRDGKHSAGSFHYIGLAEDFKRQGVSKSEIVSVLGQGYDVLEYHNPIDIFHVEYDPKI